MSEVGDSPEPKGVDLLRINRDLDSQLRELVRAQEQLFESERENSRQLARLERLAAFAIEATEQPEPASVLARAAAMVFDHFPFEQCVGFLVASDRRLVPAVACAVEGVAGDSAARLSRSRHLRLAWECPSAPLFDRFSRLAEQRALSAAVETMTSLFGDGQSGVDAPTVALPLIPPGAEPLGLMLFRRITGTLSFHEALPNVSGVAFLTLVARHVAVIVANAKLVCGLEASYAELERTQTALVDRERLAALGELAAQVAHEVRNPLGAIFNSLSLLRPHLMKDRTGRGILSVLEEESGRINLIVSDLLQFARPASPLLDRSAIMPIVWNAVEALHAASPTSVVLIDADPDLPLMPLDARMVRQALLNLLTNAAQAIDDDSPIRLLVTRDGPSLRIDVSNDGPRIPSALLERVFEPFFTTKATGTGLGLSVVKRVVDAHGGSVTVRSAEGEATVFSLLLPMG